MRKSDKKNGNAARKSSSYRRQGAFEGSTRQARSAVLRALLANGSAPDRAAVQHLISGWSPRHQDALEALCRDGLVIVEGDTLRIVD